MPLAYPQWQHIGIISVTNPPSVAFPTPITIYWQQGMRTDFADLRFSDVYGNKLTYWIDDAQTTTGVSCKVHVNVPVGCTLLYVYFGNAAASSESTIGAAFNLGDDFDRANNASVGNGWTSETDTGGTLSIDTNQLKVVANANTYCHVRQAFPSLENFVAVARMKVSSNGSASWLPALRAYWGNINNVAVGEGWSTTEKYGAQRVMNGSETLTYAAAAPPAFGTYFYVKLTFTATLQIFSYSTDGVSWTDIVNEARSGYFSGAPAYILLGKGLGMTGYTANYENNSYGTPGSSTTHYFDYVYVKPYLATEPSLSLIRTGVNPAYYQYYVACKRAALPYTTGAGTIIVDPIDTLGLSYGPGAYGPDTLSEAPTAPGLSLGALEQMGDIYTSSQALINEYPVTSIKVWKSIYDSVWQVEIEMEGNHTLDEQKCVVITMPDHTNTDQVVFVGVLPTQSNSYDDADDKTTFSGYDFAYYLTRQYVPGYELVAPAYQDPSDTISNFLGGTWWLHNTNIEPYRLLDYHSYDPNELVWGDISRMFKWAPKTTKRTAIRDLEDYTNYIFEARWREVYTGVWQPCAYWVHATQLDSPTDGLDLPAQHVVTSPDPYLLGPVVKESRGEEIYNKVTVQGFDVDGVLHSYTKELATVTSGDERPVEYLEEDDGYDTDFKCQLRAQQLFNYYIMKPIVYTAHFHSRPDLRLWQKIKFSGYDKIPDSDMRITKISYTLTPDSGLVTVDVELVLDAMLSFTNALKRSATPLWSRETNALIQASLDVQPTTEVGTITSISGNEATVTTERGTEIKARIVR